ncbi:5-formyltetrahydrofolate cyclo-ligase [soil metagenome]
MSDIPYDIVARRAKAELRKRLRGLRNTHPESAIAARSQRIVARLEELAVMKTAKCIALFWPIEARREVDLRPLDRALRERGVRVAYPAIAPPAQENEPPSMTSRYSAEAQLEERGLGFRDPSPETEEATMLDLVVVPALAADARGHRLGYGAGYYDRTLPRYAPPATTAIVVFDFQLLAEVPILDGDVACDFIVTDTRTLAASPADAGRPKP